MIFFRFFHPSNRAFDHCSYIDIFNFAEVFLVPPSETAIFFYITPREVDLCGEKLFKQFCELLTRDGKKKRDGVDEGLLWCGRLKIDL